MKQFLQSYEITLKTISPIFIGSGQSFRKKDYIYDRFQNRILILDIQKMFMGLQKMHLLEAYQRFMMDSKSHDLFQFLKEHKIDKKEYMEWVSYAAPVSDQDLINRNTKEIQTFVKDAYGNPYVPGSSLKGMLRNIIQTALLLKKKDKQKYIELLKKARTEKRNKYMKQEEIQLDYAVFHRQNYEGSRRTDEVNDMMAGFIVSDSQPLGKKQLCICQKIDYNIEGQARKMPLLRECLQPGTEIKFSISLDSTLCPIRIETIQKAITIFYKNYCRQFSDCFHNVPTINTQYPVVLLGGGVGYPSKTCTYGIVQGKEGKIQVGKILDATVSQRERRKHNHLNDARKGASPHILKCTNYNGQPMQMGACWVTQIEKFAPHLEK